MSKNWLPEHQWTFFLVLLVSPLFLCAQSSAQQTKSLLDAIEEKYFQKEFTADFEQTSTLKVLDLAEKARGKAYFSHPGKMRWEYAAPTKHQIITNGSTLWMYTPKDNQVVQGTAENFFKTGAGGAFLSDISTVKEKYSVTVAEENPKSAVLKLTPRIKTPEVKSITVQVSLTDYEIKKVVTNNIYGDTTALEFRNIRFTDIDDRTFEFSVPPSSDVIHMNQ